MKITKRQENMGKKHEKEVPSLAASALVRANKAVWKWKLEFQFSYLVHEGWRANDYKIVAMKINALFYQFVFHEF